jgi:hypothetical protein
MVIFTGFSTLSDVQTLIFDSARSPQSQGYVQVIFSLSLTIMMDICQAQGFSGDGFTGLAIIYITFAIANWIAPAVVEWIGTRIT